MGWLNATQKALAEGRSAFYAQLVHLAFDVGDGGDRYFWTGFGPLVVDGETWLGGAQLVEIGDIPFGEDDTAGGGSITLSGVDDDIVSAVVEESNTVRGRPIFIYGQFFGENLQPSDSKFLLCNGVMDLVRVRGSSGLRQIELAYDSVWDARNNGEHVAFSDRDQQARFAGDKGLERVILYKTGVRRVWPLQSAF